MVVEITPNSVVVISKHQIKGGAIKWPLIAINMSMYGVRECYQGV